MRTLPGASSFAPTRAAAAKEVPRFNHHPGRCTSIYRAKHTTKEKENTKQKWKKQNPLYHIEATNLFEFEHQLALR